MNDVIEFLTARLDEDERAASSVALVHGIWALPRRSDVPWEEARFQQVAIYGPNRARAEVAAKRAVIDMCTGGAQYPDFEGGYQTAWDETLRHLAGVYQDHPEWREEWAA